MAAQVNGVVVKVAAILLEEVMASIPLKIKAKAKVEANGRLVSASDATPSHLPQSFVGFF